MCWQPAYLHPGILVEGRVSGAIDLPHPALADEGGHVGVQETGTAPVG